RRTLWLLFGLAALLANGCAIVCGKLRAEEVANPNKDAVLPIVKALEPCQLMRRTWRASAKLMGVAKLSKELDGIINAIDAELQRLHVLCPHINGHFLAGRIRSTGIQ